MWAVIKDFSTDIELFGAQDDAVRRRDSLNSFKAGHYIVPATVERGWFTPWRRRVTLHLPEGHRHQFHQ